MTQRRWRLLCSALIVAAMVMVACGTRVGLFAGRPWFALGYWAVFLLLLCAALYLVVLDIRFIRLQYAVAKQELLRQTLGEERFRKALTRALQKEREASSEGEEE